MSEDFIQAAKETLQDLMKTEHLLDTAMLKIEELEKQNEKLVKENEDLGSRIAIASGKILAWGHILINLANNEELKMRSIEEIDV